MKNRKMLGNALLLLTAAIWGTAFVGQRVGMETIEPAAFNAARMALSAAVVAPFALLLSIRRKKEHPEISAADNDKYNRNSLIGGVCCGIFLGSASLCQQFGLVYTTAGKAGFITAMYMLLVPVIGFVLFKKKNTWLVWLAVLAGVVGMYFLCVDEQFTLAKGDALVILCAVLFSGHILCCDHFAGIGDPVRIAAIQFAAASVISAIISFAAEDPRPEDFITAAVPIIYCGVVSGGIGYTLQIVAQRFTDPTPAALLMSLESVFAVIAGTLFLHEQMSGREVIGCIIMFAAVIMVQLPVKQRRKRKDSAGFFET